MTTSSVIDAEIGTPRRRPNPGYRVAPPITDPYTPWVSALDDQLDGGEYRWILDADGALVPIRVTDKDDAAARSKRRLWGRRTQ
jgi:hypothetical protein